MTPFTDEDATLAKLWPDPEFTIEQIGARLGLTVKGVRYRADRLELGPRMAAITAWTDDRVEKAFSMWKDGHSAAQIAKAIGGGLSRSAVIGKIHRGRDSAGPGAMRAKPSPAVRTQARVALAPKVPRNKRAGAGLNMKGAKAGGPPAVIFAGPGAVLSPKPRAPFHGRADAFSALPGSRPLPWTERPFNGCSWPVGEGSGGELLSCCLPASKRGWCEAHVRMGLTAQAQGAPPTANEMMRSLRKHVA